MRVKKIHLALAAVAALFITMDAAGSQTINPACKTSCDSDRVQCNQMVKVPAKCTSQYNTCLAACPKS